MNRIAVSILTAVSISALTGCYGAKMVKGPINSEHAAVQADSIRADQRRILLELAQLRRQFEEDREARLRSQAQTSVTLSELEESVRILVSRVEDSEQRISNRRTTSSYPSSPPRPVPSDTTASDTTAVRVHPGEEEEIYRAAYLDLTRGNSSLAIQGFQSYLVRYPAGPRVSEVHYYLGECYYSEERYLEAVGAFQDVVRKFPDSRLVPAAYLKSGFCYRQLDERSLAEKALRTLIERHPDTEEAKQAHAALENLEG